MYILYILVTGLPEVRFLVPLPQARRSPNTYLILNDMHSPEVHVEL